MNTYEEVRAWFDATTWAPWNDWSDLDEDLCEIVDFASDALLAESDNLLTDGVLATDETDLRLRLTAALFFYVGHRVANGADLSAGVKALLSAGRAGVVAADPTLSSMTGLQHSLDAIAALTSDSVDWPW